MRLDDIKYAKSIGVNLIPNSKLFPIVLYRSITDLLYNWIQLLLVLIPAELYFNKHTFLTYPIRKFCNIDSIWEGFTITAILLIIIFGINIVWSKLNDKLEYRAMESVFNEEHMAKVTRIMKAKDPNFEYKKLDPKLFNNTTSTYNSERIISILSFLIVLFPLLLPTYYFGIFNLLAKLDYVGVGALIFIYTSIFSVFFQLRSIFHPIIRPYEFLFAGYFPKDVLYSLVTQGQKDMMGFIYGYKEGTNIKKGYIFAFVNSSLVLYSLNNASIIYPISTFIIFFILYYIMDYSAWNKTILMSMTCLSYKKIDVTKKDAETDLKIYTKTSSEASGAKRNIKKRYKIMKSFMTGNYSDLYTKE